MKTLQAIQNHIKANQLYTIVKFGEMGFPYSLTIKFLESQFEPWAQFPETLNLVYIPFKKRTPYTLRLRPDLRNIIIWEGIHNPTTEMFVRKTEDGSEETLLSFDTDYIKRALDSVPVVPLVYLCTPILPIQQDTFKPIFRINGKDEII